MGWNYSDIIFNMMEVTLQKNDSSGLVRDTSAKTKIWNKMTASVDANDLPSAEQAK